MGEFFVELPAIARRVDRLQRASGHFLWNVQTPHPTSSRPDRPLRLPFYGLRKNTQRTTFGTDEGCSGSGNAQSAVSNRTGNDLLRAYGLRHHAYGLFSKTQRFAIGDRPVCVSNANMNMKDFLRIGVPLGEATRRATDFVSKLILDGGNAIDFPHGRVPLSRFMEKSDVSRDDVTQTDPGFPPRSGCPPASPRRRGWL